MLFLNAKASSSGKVKPPMGADLLDYYNPDQLRAHFLALGLGLGYAVFSQLLQPLLYTAIVLTAVALLMYHFYTHAWFLRHKNR